MKSVVRFTLAQNVFFNLIFVLLMVVGAFSLLQLPVERYPLVNFGKVFISTTYRGASPKEVEALITQEIEDALEGLEDVEFIQSTSYRGRSRVVVKFDDDTDYDDLYKELRFRIINIQKNLPEDADPPTFVNIKTSDWLPVVSVNLSGDRGNRALSLMAEELKIPLERIPGVQEVSLQGEYDREFKIYLDPQRMSRLGVTLEEVATALNAANVSIPAGDFEDKQGEFVVIVDEKFRSSEQALDVIVRRDGDGSFVRVRNVAAGVELGYSDPVVISSINGRDGISLKIIKTEAGNALSIKEAADKIIDQFRPQLQREGVELVETQDSTIYINDAMDTLGLNLLAGVILVSLLIWYFMGFRNACLTTIGIPFSFLTTMILMYVTGNSLNEITLFSFVLVSGIIVDDAIVVVENIYRHVQEGEPLVQAIVDGTHEVAFPVISATTTTVAAFLPMLIMTGSTGEFFALIPKAVAFAITASLAECLFILPLHYLDWGPRPSPGRHEEKDNFLLKGFRWLTNTVTAFTLRFRFLSIGIVLAAFAVSVAILGASAMGKSSLIRIKFYPDDYNLYYVNVFGPSTTSVEAISDKLKEISRFIMADGPGMAASAVGMAGFYITEDYQHIYGNNYGNVAVTMPARDDQHFKDTKNNDPTQHLENMRRRIEQAFEKDGYTVQVRAERGGPPSGKDINVRILGTEPDQVQMLSQKMLEFMRASKDIAPYVADLDTDVSEPNRVFRFLVKKERASEYGLSPSEVASLAASVLDGRYIGEFRTPDEDIDMKLGFSPDAFDSPEQALAIPLIEHDSGPIRLSDLCDVEAYSEPGALRRYNGYRAINIEGNLNQAAQSKTSVPVIIAKIRQFYQTIREQFPSATIEFGGEFESTQRSYLSLSYAFIIAVLLIYLILANQFKSYLQPLIILSAVAFSLIGVVFGKVITQTLFTVNSFIAVVGVTGVVVNDSLVLIDFINSIYAQGKTRAEAVREGIRVRLRPILLTTLTTTLGLLPMAIGFPNYSLVWGTMASTFVTGLCTATALTLFIVPVEWDLLQGFHEWRKKRKLRRTETIPLNDVPDGES